ncbi:hypothetical protein NDU88_006174 [Pleurodeles waltl]|uniref:Uncharacterized protein n=1 Tax=Pleurodeles waltl TaxID=8319 RepID=A0AAV7N0I2_PLEWA|nr:hypothetical protein NDU88_006174 [Pleurodeles waltl]
MEREITDLEEQMTGSAEPTIDQCHRLRLKQKELKDFAENTAREHTLEVQRRLYDVGDQAGKWIVLLVRRDMGRNWVAELRGEEKRRFASGPEIAEAFASYCEKIYASRTVHMERDCVELLGDLQLQVLLAEDKSALEQDLAVEEV